MRNLKNKMATSSFFADLDNPQKKQSSNSFFSDIETPSDYKSLKKAGRLGAQYGIGTAERIATPYEIAVSPLASKKAQMAEYRKGLFEDIERLQEQKLTGDWDQKDEQLLKTLIDQASDYKKAEPFVKTADIGVGSLLEKGAKQFGLDLEPEDVSETAARITGNVLKPSSIVKGVQKAGKLTTQAGREELKLLKQEKNWQKLGRAAAKNPHKEQLLSFAKNEGLTPEEATLLLQSDGKIQVLEKIGSKSKKLKNTVNSLKEKLGSSYDELKEAGKNEGLLGPEIRSSMQGDFQKILNEIEESYVIGPDTESAKKILEKTQYLLGSKEGTIKDLINSRQEIRQGINWRNVDRGDFLRDEAVKAITKGIEAKSPEIAKKLLDTDKAYSRYAKFADILDKKQPLIMIKGIPIPIGMGDLVFGTAAYSLGGWKAVLSKYAIKKLTTKFITEPKYQALHTNLMHAINNGATKKQAEIFTAMKKMMRKDDPDLYEEFKNIDVKY